MKHSLLSLLFVFVSIACFSRDPAGYRDEWDSTPLPTLRGRGWCFPPDDRNNV